MAVMLTFVCQVCGNEVIDKASSNRKFCSRDCSHKGRVRQWAQTITVQCPVCGKPFECFARRNSKGNQRRYCSKKCANGINNQRPSNPKTFSCIQCGKEGEDRPGLSRKFCSMQCKGAWQSDNLTGEQNPNYCGGYIQYYGPDWVKQRNKARQRDKYRCQHCGVTEKKLKRELDVHHIKPFREFGLEQHEEANHLSNLISLCRACHKSAEYGKINMQLPLLYD